MQHKVEICGVNTSKLKVLKNEETRALLLRAKEGRPAAREELISGEFTLGPVCDTAIFQPGARMLMTYFRWAALG